MIYPTNESALVINGSTLKPTPISPPGTAYIKAFLSALRDVIYDSISLQFTAPVLGFLVMRPGLIEILSPTFNTPRRIVPPATPPTNFSASVPGLFTSKERIIIIYGGDVKSLTGTGILHK